MCLKYLINSLISTILLTAFPPTKTNFSFSLSRNQPIDNFNICFERGYFVSN